MSDLGAFRLLIVEDELNWGRRLEARATESRSFARVDWAKTKSEALDMIAGCHYHFVSIDQNLPDAPRELVLAENGLKLCEEIVSLHPLTNRSILTANGATSYSNRIGRLDGTEYFEKRVAETAAEDGLERVDADPYIDGIAAKLRDDYLYWSLSRAGQRLPRALGGSAEELCRHWWKEQAWLATVDSLSQLWERALELAWAQTAALTRYINQPVLRAKPGMDPYTPAAKEADMAELWPLLDAAALLHPWQKFLSPATGSASKKRDMRHVFGVLHASRILRDLRNDRAHGRLPEPAESDLISRLSSIYPLVDLLAGWAEMPLIEGARRHPQHRGLVQFNILGGAPPWQLGEAPDKFDTIPQVPHVFIRWHENERPFLLDLHPFVLRKRSGTRHEPHVFCKARMDSHGALTSATYRSLATGNEIVVDRSTEGELIDELAPLLAQG